MKIFADFLNILLFETGKPNHCQIHASIQAIKIESRKGTDVDQFPFNPSQVLTWFTVDGRFF